LIGQVAVADWAALAQCRHRLFPFHPAEAVAVMTADEPGEPWTFRDEVGATEEDFVQRAALAPSQAGIDLVEDIRRENAHVAKLRTNDPATSSQPLTNTKNTSLIGKLTTMGGSIIMPMPMRIAETAISMTRKGRNRRNPI